MQKTLTWSLAQEDPPGEELATQSSILAWEIPQTKEPDRLQSKRSQRVGHDLAAKQQLGDSEGQKRLVCCSPWFHTESDANYIKKFT